MPTLLGIRVPDTEFRYRNRAAPNSGTDIATATTWVTSIRICNRTASAVTFTLVDKDTTPFEYYSAVSIPARTVTNERIAAPLKFVGGITLTAGTADALTVEIMGWQDPV